MQPTHISCLILNTNNHFTLPPSLFQIKVLISLNSVFWNTLTPLETLICHISISAIFTQFQIRLWRFLSLKPITMNEILDTTQSCYSTLIFMASFALTDPLSIKDFFLQNQFTRSYTTKTDFCFLIIHDTPQLWRNYLQGGDRERHRFLKYIQTKQTVKICSFDIVWWFFCWNLNKAEAALLRN